jgi:cytochrome P450
MITLLMAGHLTTAVTLSWAIHFLLHNPRTYDRTRSTLAAGDDSYLDAVVKETLRMRPAVPLVARVLQRPFEFDGYRLPAGTLLAIPIMLVHHLERLFPDPHAFRPERFIDGGPEPSHYIPYGRGIRRCVGAGLADYELRLVLRTILERTTMRAPEPELEQPRGLGMPTIVPAKGARVTMLDRSAA